MIGTLAVEKSQNIIGHHAGVAFYGLFGCATQVWSEHSAVEIQERVVRRDWMSIEHIEGCARDLPVPQRFGQGFQIDDARV